MDAARRVCDRFCDIFREQPWKYNGRKCAGHVTYQKEYDDVEKAIVTCIKGNGKASRSELEKNTYKSRGTVINRLNKLLDKGLIKVNGDIHDPRRTYGLE